MIDGGTGLRDDRQRRASFSQRDARRSGPRRDLRLLDALRKSADPKRFESYAHIRVRGLSSTPGSQDWITKRQVTVVRFGDLPRSPEVATRRRVDRKPRARDAATPRRCAPRACHRAATRRSSGSRESWLAASPRHITDAAEVLTDYMTSAPASSPRLIRRARLHQDDRSSQTRGVRRGPDARGSGVA